MSTTQSIPGSFPNLRTSTSLSLSPTWVWAIPTKMVPNLDLFLLAFLHYSFIAIILLLVISFMLIVLLLSFFLGLFSIVIIDLYDASFPIVSWWFETTKANLQLGLVLIVCSFIIYVVEISLASKPVFERVISSFRVKSQAVVNYYLDALKLA